MEKNLLVLLLVAAVVLAALAVIKSIKAKRAERDAQLARQAEEARLRAEDLKIRQNAERYANEVEVFFKKMFGFDSFSHAKVRTMTQGVCTAQDLQQIWKTHSLEPLRAMAFMLLLLPDRRYAEPFGLNFDGHDGENHLLVRDVRLDKLPERLRRFIAGLVFINDRYGLVHGPVEKLSRADLSRIYLFNELIIQALQLDDPQGQLLMSCYKVSEPYSLIARHAVNGYNVLEHILFSGVPLSYKQAADLRFQEALTGELVFGKIADHNMLWQVSRLYAGTVCVVAERNPLPYSPELLVAQIRFLLELAENHNGLLQETEARLLLDRLPASYESERRRLAKYANPELAVSA